MGDTPLPFPWGMRRQKNPVRFEYGLLRRDDAGQWLFTDGEHLSSIHPTKTLAELLNVLGEEGWAYCGKSEVFGPDSQLNEFVFMRANQ